MACAKDSNTGTLVSVNLLKYRFRFRRMSWREEARVRLDRGEDPVRAMLAYALADVSGIVPSSIEEAKRVMQAIPEPIVARVWKVYRGSMPPARRFSTSGLYQAPEPSAYTMRVIEDEKVQEGTHERLIREMEQRFGKQEVAEEMEISRKVLESARKSLPSAPARPAPERSKRRGQ